MTRRFIAVLVGLVVVVLASLEVPLGVNFARDLEGNALVELERDALAVGDLIEEYLEGEVLDPAPGDVVAAYAERTNGRVVVVDAAGTAIADGDPPPGVAATGRNFATRPEMATALGGTVSRGARLSETVGEELLYVAVPVVHGDAVLGAVRITRGRADLDAEIRRYWTVLGVIAVITVGVAAALGAWFGTWASKPLVAVRDAAVALGRGELSARAPSGSGPPEVRELARRLNATAERLGQLIDSSRDFAADASHQLRTPLTALRLRLDNLVDGPGVVDAAALDPVVDDIERLERILDGLLALSRLDRTAVDPVPVAVDEVVDEALETWHHAAVDAGATLISDVGPRLAMVDRGHLGQVLDNLISNALDVAPPGTSITLSAQVAGDEIELHVVDQGPGLSEADRVHAIQRGWHESATGSGLGLAIVDRLLRFNGGRVRLEHAPGGGLDVVVTLPVVPRRNGHEQLADT